VSKQKIKDLRYNPKITLTDNKSTCNKKSFVLVIGDCSLKKGFLLYCISAVLDIRMTNIMKDIWSWLLNNFLSKKTYRLCYLFRLTKRDDSILTTFELIVFWYSWGSSLKPNHSQQIYPVQIRQCVPWT